MAEKRQEPLSRSSILSIVDLRLAEVQQRLADRKITLQVSDAAKEHLASIGYSSVYGARPLNRAIQNELLNPMAVLLLGNRILEGEVAKVGFDGPSNRLVIEPNHDAPADGTDMVLDDDIDIEELEMD